jgi:hypothetical protein
MGKFLMALRNIATFALKTILAGAASLGLSIANPNPAAAIPAHDLVFHLTLCDQSEMWENSPCYVEQAPSAPIPVGAKEWIAAGLTEKFNPSFQFPPQSVNILGSDTAGHIIGLVNYEAYNIHFIAKDGTILCCWEDFPWTLYAINAHGIVIGTTNYTPSVGHASQFAHARPVLDNSSAALIEQIYPDMPPGTFFSVEGLRTRFISIDNENRIFGDNRDYWFRLTLVSPASQIPEPGGIFLLATALGLAWAYGRGLPRRKRTASPTGHR